jgi:hypothetical protein
MTENQKNAEDGWVMLNTKVPPHIGKLFDMLANQRGMKSYELLQLLVNGFITAAKHDGPLTPELRLLIDSLKLDVAFCKAFNFASPTAQSEIAQIVLILQQPGNKGFGLQMIDKPYFDDATTTYCIDQIMERVVEVGMDDLYKELRQLGVSLETKSIRETLITMCDAQKFELMRAGDEEEMPGMGNFHDFGKAVEYGQKTKAYKHRTPDSLHNAQQHLQFHDFDREKGVGAAFGTSTDPADAIEDAIGGKPFGVEP